MMKDIKLKLIAISCIFLILGMPVYTARVFAQDEEQVIEDKTPPSINIEKPPEKVSEPFLDIKGTTNEPVVIEVTLNSNYYGTASSTEDNSISIGITLTEGENKIVINSTDAGGNFVIKEFNVFCDSEQPQIIYNNIYELSPAYTAEQTVKGQVNKADINIDVFVNGKKENSGKSDSEGNFEIDIKLDKNIKIGVTDKSITVGTEEGNAWENKIKIVATDDYGRETTVEDIITYTLCGYGSDWDVKTGKITPDVVIPEYLIQGIAQFSFPINLTYRGRGDPSEVALTSEPQLTSYGLSLSSMEEYQDELFAGSATSYWNDDYTIGYFVVNLNTWSGSKEELNNLSFIKIPVRLDVYYEYEDMNGDTVENTQRNCWTISIMVDKEIPLDKIPKKLLNSTVNLLNSTITLIDAIKKPIDTVKKYTFVGCAASWALYFVQSLSVEFSCVNVKQDAIIALINGDDTCSVSPEQDTSGNIIGGDCDACLQSLKSLRETEKIRNWLCDRIFCPSVPSLDYHKESYKDSITGVNLCKGITDEKYGDFFNGRFGLDSDECEEEYKFAWDSAFMTLDEWEKANVEEGEVKESFFDKISEGLAFCEKAKEQNATVITVGSGTKQEVYVIGKDGEVRKASTWAKIEGDAIPQKEGVLIQEGGEKIFYTYETKEPLNIDEKGSYVYKGEAKKFYEKSGNIYVCIGEICDKETEGINVFNNNIESEKTQFYIDDNGKIQHWNDKVDEKVYKPFTSATDLYEDNDGNIKVYSDKTKESDIKKIPPIVQSNRGIEGTDNYILDPTSDIIRSVQAVCLPAVSGYLNLWKQILEAVKQCFETIMITGEGSAGVCKAVLTTYVCDMIYDVIRCTGESFTLGADDKVSGGIVGVMQKISTAGTNVLSSVEGRYGQTGMYNTMFNEKKLIHSACLFAFTGDWGEFDLDTMLSADIGMPTLGSEGFLYPTTRRFMGSNPLDYGRTTYIYHIGAGLIAGADLNYRVYLQCSNDNSCSEGRCDCFYRGKEEVYNVASGSLSAGDLYTDEFYIDIPDSLVRYDKAVIEWDWTDNNGQSQTTTKVQKIDEAGEGTPSDCKLDSKSGEFRCKYIIGQYGDARFIDIYPLGNKNLKKEPYLIGDTIDFNVEVEVIPPDSGDKIPKYLTWKITDQKNKEIKREDPFKIPITEGSREYTLPGYTIGGDAFGSETESTVQTKKLIGYNDVLDIERKLYEIPKESVKFAVVFINEKEYKVYYQLDNNLEIDDYSKYEEGNYDATSQIVEYKDKNIKIKLLTKDPKKDYAAVIIVEMGQKIEGCVDGKATWKVKFELLHSKEKDDSYECCGKSIDTKEFEIIIDCDIKVQDAEQQCVKNTLINEKCKCGEVEGNYCGSTIEGWTICCENSNVCKTGINDTDVIKAKNDNVLDKFINDLCNK